MFDESEHNSGFVQASKLGMPSFGKERLRRIALATNKKAASLKPEEVKKIIKGEGL